MYEKSSMILRVVGFDSNDFSGGTMITGELKSEFEAELYEPQVSMITLITQNRSLSKITETLLASFY